MAFWRVTVPVFLIAGLTACGSQRGAQALTAPSAAASRQACVEQWNWMHYVGDFIVPPLRSVPAVVRTAPCRIEIDYRLPDAPRIKSLYFPCEVNRFHAYVCAGHAHGRPTDPPRTGHNARYFSTTGRIQLARRPQHLVAVARPAWVKRYPVAQGFIVPFDSHGRLRPGLTLRAPLPAPYTCATFPKTSRTTLIGCGAGLHCFVPRLPVSNHELLACPMTPGSPSFFRSRLDVLS